ncbi:S-layer homology domain-containing protein [Paenibacillus kyungheensis]|uniref:S-layer homology domain-containing protein n=1 Tax=Paenibacillus kyungheensis TaxID=1452732 RepID=A0AAX3M1L3_9BACL|nr:S-layer homology domain-containing protein [Paenibacillus kyungheensis]WCT56036.1 S-layer homology domain-containing protein [Paenibacillus kyungheensis]
MKKRSYSVFIVFLIVTLIFTGLPRYASAAAGSMTITSADGVQVVGQSANLSVTYNLGDVISLLGSITYTLPAGIKATTADQINGRNLVASEITNNGQTVTITTAALLLLPSTTLTLNNKILPAAGNYQFTGTSKNTLNVSIGSATQQGTFTILPAPTAPSSAQISVNNVVVGSSTVKVTGQTQGDTISVYNTSNTLLGSGVVNAQGTAVIAATLVPSGGTINVSTVRGTAESTKTSFTYGSAVLNSIPAANIAIDNQYGDQDTVTVTGVSAGDVVTVYNGTTAIGNATANASGVATVTTTLTPDGGSVGVTLKRNTIESTPTTVSYGAQVIPPIVSGNITVTNSYGGTSTVKVSGLTVGDIVTVSSGNTVLATAPATTSSLSLPVVLAPTGGSLSVTIKQGLLQSAATTVNYPSITVPVIGSANIQVNNRSGNTSDTVVVTGQLAGDTVNVYNADGLLGTGTVNAQGTVTIPVVLTPIGGSVNIGLNHNGVDSAPTAVSYLAEVVTPLLTNQISLSPIVAGNATATISGLTNGDIVKVYGNGTVLGTATAGVTGTVAIPVAVNPLGGSLGVGITRNGIDSVTTSIPYGGVVVPAIPVANITVNNASGNSDTVQITGQTAGNIVTVYGNGSVIGTGVVNAQGTALLNVTLVPLGGTIGVTTTNQGVESIASTVIYGAEVTPAISANAILVTNNSGDNDIVQVSGLTAGDSIDVYGAGSLLGTATVQADGKATLNTTLLPIGGTVGVTLIRNGVESAPTLANYTTEVVAALLQENVAIVNDIAGNSSVTVKALQSGDIINVYANGTLIGTSPADANGLAKVNTDLAPNGGVISVSLVRNTIESTAIQVGYAAVLIPAIPSEDIVPANNYGDNDTVTIEGLDEGQKVNIYSGSDLIGTGTAPANGNTVINLTLIPTGGSVSATLEYLGLESQPVSVNYPTEIVPPIPAAAITVLNNAGNADSVTVTGLPEGNKVTISEAGSILGTGTVTSSGDVTINLTLNPTGGTISAINTHSNIDSVPTPVVYLTEPGPVLLAADVQVINNIGSNDTVKVSNVQSGDMIWVLDANNTVLGTGLADGSGLVTIQLALLPEGGQVSVILSRNQINSNLVNVNYIAEEVAPPADTPTAEITQVQGVDGVITVIGMTEGETAKVYDDDDQVLGTGVANIDGQAIINFKFLKAQGRLFVRTVVNGVETTVNTFDYQGIPIPVNPTTPTAVLSDIDGAQGTIDIANGVTGDIVKVYSDDDQVLGTATIGSDGTAILNFTFPNVQGELSVRVTTNGTETEIATLPYSGIDIPTTPTPAATITDITGDQGTVDITGVAVGEVVKVYDEDNNVLGTAVAGSNGSAQIVFTFPNAQGELSVRVTVNGTETEITTLPYSGVVIPTTPTPGAAITDIAGDQGTINITGVAVGEVVKVYDEDNNVLGTAVAGSNGSAQIIFTFPNAQGELSVRVTTNGTETEIATLPYSGIDIPTTPTPAAVIADITGDQGTVNITGVAVGEVVKVYDEDNNVLGTAVAGSNGSAQIVFTFPNAQGELSVRVTVNGTETEITTLPYSGIDIPTTPTPGAAITDIAGDQGTVTVSGVAVGNTISIYSDANEVLATGTANANGEAILTFTFPNAQGELSVRVTINGAETEIATLPYSGIDIPTTPTPSAVITDITGDQGTVNITGVAVGEVVKVYDEDNNVLGTAVVGSNGSAQIDFTFPNAQGELSVRVTVNGTETEIATLPYSGIDIPTTPSPSAVITDITGDQGTVNITGVAVGEVVKVYDEDNNVLGTAVAGSNGSAQIVFTFPNAQGELSVRVTVNGTETEITTLPYSGIDIPTTPSPNAVITDITGSRGTVNITGVTANSPVTIYSDANEVLATGTVDGSGQLTLTFIFPNAQGELSVRVTVNGLETEIAALPYSGIDIPTTPTPAAVIADITGDQGTVNITDVAVGEVVKVYDEDNNVLGTAVAGSNGSAQIVFTFPNAQGELSVRVTVNGTETEITTLPYSGVVIPTTPSPNAVITDIAGDQGTVNITGVAVGEVVKVYDEDNNVLGTAVAGSNGSAQIVFTFPNAQGELSVRVTINGTETEIATLPYSGIDIPTTPTPGAAITDIAGDQGTITVSGVAVGNTISIYSDANEVLATGTANANGEAVLTFTFPNAQGELSVRVTINGTETEIATLPYSGIDIPTTPTPAADLTTINGDQGTVTVSGVTVGNTISIYSDANEVLATGTANANGEAVLTFTFPNAQGELSVRVTINGTETEIATLPYSGIDIPTTPTPAADLTTINGDQGTVTVSGVAVGNTISIYSDANEVLATGTANANGEAVLTFTFPNAQGELSVRVTINGTETEIATLPYSGIDIPTTPTPAADLTTINGDQGTVTVSGVAVGNTISIYSDANEVLATGTANANGEAVLTFTFPNAQGELSVRVTINGTETEIATLPYSGIDIPTTPTPAADLTTINGDQGTVTVSGVAVGNTISIYSDANEVLATGTANANGEAILTFTFPNAQGELSVRVTINGTETEIATLPYSGIDIPTTPTPAADLTTINGDQGTVTVSGVTVGNTISIYSDANEVLATGTANANGEAVLTFTFPNAQGELSVRVTINGTETEIGTLPYNGVEVPPTTPPTPVVNLVDVQGTQGTIQLSGLQAGDIVTVQSDVYEQGTVQLGTITIGADGNGNLNIQLPASEGQLVITLNRNGNTSVLQTINYREGETPPPTNPPTNPGTSDDDDNVGSNRTPGVLGIPAPVTAATVDTPVPAVEEPVTLPADNAVEAASGEATDVELDNTTKVTLVTTNKQNFNDVSGHWAESEINRLQDLSILNGVGDNQYNPDALITRAQFTQMISNLLQVSSSTDNVTYSDVAPDKWYYNAINAVSATGITKGYTDDSYQPDQQITREEMSNILNNTLSYLEPSTSFAADANQALTPFTDRNNTSNWAKNSLATAVNEGIMQGRPNGQIAPKDNTTRAEAAMTISRLMDKMATHFNITE